MTILSKRPSLHVRVGLPHPLPTNESIAVVQCLYPRLTDVDSKSISVAAVNPAFESIVVSASGIEHQLGLDNCPPFNSYQFPHFVSCMDFEHIRITSYKPQVNGTVEHFMPNLGKILRISRCVPNKQGKKNFRNVG